MTETDRSPGNATELRRLAEELARERAAQSPQDVQTLSPEEVQQALHELRVHQIELEMQNEELRQAQIEQDDARARYFDLYDLAPVGYVTLNEQGMILEANLTAAKLLGVARGARALQPAFSMWVLQEDQSVYFLHRKQLFETGEPQAYELRLVKKDGTAFWAHLDTTATQGIDGAPVCRVVLSDITELIKTQEALQKAQQEVHALHGMLPICAWCKKIRDDEGYWNGLEAYIQEHSEATFSHGICPECFVQMRQEFKSETSEEDDQASLPACPPIPPTHTEAALRQRAEAIAQQENALRQDSQEAFPQAESRQAFHDLRVNQIELEMQNEELRRTHSELEAARGRYFDLYDLAPVGYVTLDEHGLILEANLAAAALLGAPRGVLERQSIARFLFKEDVDSYYLHSRKLLEIGAQQAWEMRMVKTDGTVFWAHLEVTYAQEDKGAFVRRLVLSDITERMRAEEERCTLLERVSRSQSLEALGVMVAGVAHNINNVLTAIMASGSLRELLTSDSKDREAYQIIGSACRRGREVVKSLVNFAKPTLSTLAPLELHTLINEVQFLLESTTRSRVNIVEAYCGQPLWIHGDAGSLNHALMNLCLNALDAMPNGGNLTFRTGLCEPDWAEVSIEDDGQGMTQEILARVLEPFFTTKEVGKGTGLGLSMTHGVVKAHGGTLELVSTPGQGTIVKLRLPRIPAPALTQTLEAPRLSLGPLRVLLVDDDEDVRYLVARMLRNEGMQVESVAGGEEALERLGSGLVPDLIILDQNMPGMNGIQTMEKIRVKYQNVPILVSSGQPDIHEWACFKQPNVDVISKPFATDEILAKLAGFVEGSRPWPSGQ